MKRYKWQHTTKQKRRYDCGITCVINVLRYQKIEACRKEFRFLLNDTQIKRNGASIFDLVKALKNKKLPAIGVKCDFGTLQRDKRVPAILAVSSPFGERHYIILYEIDDSKVTIADPCIWRPRIMSLSREEFFVKYLWQGEAIILK